MNAKDLKRALSRVLPWPGVGLVFLTGMGFGLSAVSGVSDDVHPAGASPRTVFLATPSPRYEFYFTRAIYSSGRGWGWGGRGSWATDYPKADRQFLVVIKKLLGLDAYDTFLEIDEIKQVPNVRQGRYGGPTWEQDGYEPRVLGIYDDDGRLMVVINWNTDLGDAWEWAEDPFYPMEYSNFAYEMGANLIIYAMSH